MADIGIITFQLGHVNFCMDADQILEIVRYNGVRTIPRPLPYVLGVIELRKHIVTVVDFRKRLGLPALALSEATVMIVAMLSSGTFGLLVEGISDFRRVPQNKIMPPISIAGFPEQLLKGVFPDRQDIMLIPDLDKIFSSYIHLRLVPITSAEKIAFQYRFTPGALSQTLEKNLLRQHVLEASVVKKLARSLCLPSVVVHRMISYHPDFHPRQIAADQPEGRSTGYRLKAGDEKYAVLSHRLASPQTSQQPQQSAVKGQDGRSALQERLTGLLQEWQGSLAPILEKMVGMAEGLSEPVCVSQAGRQVIPAVNVPFWRGLARRLQIAPARLTRYISYYLPSPVRSASLAEGQTHPQRTAVQPAAQGIASTESPLFELMQTLHALRHAGQTLTPAQAAQICQHYQIRPGKLARIISYFPECDVTVEFPAAAQPAESTGEPQPEVSSPHAPSLAPNSVPFDPATRSLSENLAGLTEHNLLSNLPVLRHVASRLRLSTCRLNKVRTYYRWLS